ncbi:MAG: NADH-quinone oxidoreductase subunit B [Nitrospiraceae bacterium]|nr:MAG: NADH-quinone oxidoreductase subunit B [Nitrospiraceae bacterium]
MDVMNENQVNELLQNKVILTTTDKLLGWFRSRSIFPVTFGLACCAIEMLNASSAKFDFARFGYEAFRGSPRQADLMIVAGTITKKMQPLIARLYEQMAEPKWVMCMGSCAISGGPFTDSYHVVPGADMFLPVDVYIPGCPPRPEALVYGFLTLREKIFHPDRISEKINTRLKEIG